MTVAGDGGGDCEDVAARERGRKRRKDKGGPALGRETSVVVVRREILRVEGKEGREGSEKEKTGID